jgi:predicted acyl esterase
MKMFLRIIYIIILAGAIPGTTLSQTETGTYDVERTDFKFALSDGIKLECTKFVPKGEMPTGGWPAMIFCHGFGGNKEGELPHAEDQAKFGYYTIVYSMRGQGKSGGKSNLISTLEMRDFTELVSYVKNEETVNPDIVGATGGSQGGTIPFMAACNGLDLKCIVSDVASPDFATSWIENNSVKMTLLWSLSYDTTIVRYNNRVKRMREWILSEKPDHWDSLAFYIPLERDFMNRVEMCNTPIMISTVWQDKFFNTRGMIQAGEILKSPFRMYYGTFDAHGADPYEPEMRYQEHLTGDWVNYWMGGQDNGVMDSARYVYSPSLYPVNTSNPPAMWTWSRGYSNTWPPPGTDDVKFYFTGNGNLTNEEGEYGELEYHNDVSGISLTEAVNYEFKGNNFDSKFKKNELGFVTELLKEEVMMAGTPSVHLNYSCNATVSQYNFQIWEIHPDNTTKLVTRINYTDRDINPNVVKTAIIEGLSHSHIFQKGSRIKIVLTNLDNATDDRFLRTNPFVLPVIKKSSSKIFVSGSDGSYITLPLINYVK